MKFTHLRIAVLFLAVGAPSGAQILGLGGKKMVLKRALPPALELEARSFAISATSQDPAGRAVAASFAEIFRGKVQGYPSLVLKESNPDLRIAINLTRFYIEPKQLTRSGKNPAPCTTYLGNLQGTFSIIDTRTRTPLASDVIGWKLQAGRYKHWLTGDDGSQMNIGGPKEKLGLNSAWEFMGEEGGGRNFLPSIGKSPHPCDVPFSKNETQDALAEAFLTDLIHLAIPYETTVEVSLPGGKFKRISEDVSGGRPENAREEIEKLGEFTKNDDEGERLYLLGLTHEIAGYKLGTQIFTARQKLKPDNSPEEMANLQSEIKKLVDQAKDHFDQAALSFKRAAERKPEKEYRDAERRADQSQRLYARIKRYRQPDVSKLAPRALPPAGLTMAEITGLCSQGLADVIIADRIERAPSIAATRQEIGELSKCGSRQTAIFKALKERWDGKDPAASPAKRVPPPVVVPKKPLPAAKPVPKA